jgi:hypothetical protein
MLIVAGSKTYDEADWLLANGAAEVYCGVPTLPCRPGPDQCFQNDEEFIRIARRAAACGKRALLALDGACSVEEYSGLARRAKALVKACGCPVLVRELPLFHYLYDSGLRAEYIIGGLSLVYNSRALDYFNNMGVKRVVLPFHLLPGEAGRVINNRYGMETEIRFHADFRRPGTDPACRLPEPGLPQMLDAVYDSFHSGIKYLNIMHVTDLKDQREVLKEARVMLALLEKGVSREDFRKLGGKLYFSLAGHGVRTGR